MAETRAIADLCAGFEARRVAAAALDGDGVEELVVAQSAALVGDLSTVSVLTGGQTCGLVDLVADAETTWTYQDPGANDRLLAGPDLDGDGLGDIVFAQAVWDAEEGTTTPTVWVFDGDQGGPSSMRPSASSSSIWARLTFHSPQATSTAMASPIWPSA